MVDLSAGPLRIVELFSGVGGVSAAVQGTSAVVVAAVDTDEAANRVHATNWPAPVVCRNLSGRKLDFLPAADLWWMSPPCQPFTVRGKQRDVMDPRCRPLLRMLEALADVHPTWVALENVPGFSGSLAYDALRDTLRKGGWQTVEGELCPSDFGLPNIRRRWYLLAGPRPPRWPNPARMPRTPIRAFLDSQPDPELTLSPTLVSSYAKALPFSNPDDTDTCCFTSAYGSSPVYCGSYLRDEILGPRRFSPIEIARLLGFPKTFRFPEGISLRKQWSLIGNSLSVPVVGALLEDAISWQEAL